MCRKNKYQWKSNISLKECHFNPYIVFLEKRWKVQTFFAGPEEALKENLEKPVHEEPEETKESDSQSSKKEEGEESKGNDSSTADDKKNGTSTEGDKKKPKVVVIKEPIEAELLDTMISAMTEEHFQKSNVK